MKCIMKKRELWVSWEETKGRNKHDRTCLDHDEEIATTGGTPLEATGHKSPAKC
jgi:hypothetical protein